MKLVKQNLLVYVLTVLTSAVVVGPILALLDGSSPFYIDDFIAVFFLIIMYSIFFCVIPLSVLLIYTILVIKLNFTTLRQKVLTGAALSLLVSLSPVYLKNYNRPDTILPMLIIFTIIGGITGYFHYKKVKV